MPDDPKEQWRASISRPLKIRPFSPDSSAVIVEMAAASLPGTLKPQNTEHYLALRFSRLQETIVTSLASADLPERFEEHAYVLLVADGFNDEAGGRASRLALSALTHLAIQYGKWNTRVSPETAADIIAQGEFFWGQLHNAIREARRTDVRVEEMASDLTALYIAETHLFFVHVGRSSAFLFRDGILIRLTSSESQPDVTEKLGGTPAPPHIHTEHIKLLTGDRLLLCTNGLTDVVIEDRIADVLSARRSPNEDCRRLVDEAAATAHADDVTVMLADYTLRD